MPRGLPRGASLLLLPSTVISGNVALNADVTLDGTFFTGGWGAGQTVDKQTIVDGIFLPEMTQWDQGGVWWDSTSTAYADWQTIYIDLKAMYKIDSIIAQVDNNDQYNLYFSTDNVGWYSLWRVPAVSGYGLMTRSTSFVVPVDMRYIVLQGAPSPASDNLFSISEIQVFEAAVPEPASMLLFGIGLMGLAGVRRFKN